MGGGFTASSTNKIKGGKWTVVKFAAVSVGYTIVWMALCSELNTFRTLYGPSVLLKMNIVYYVPSIPLLILSSYVDEPLDKYFGVAMTVLLRLLIGNGACAVIAFIFPFEPHRVTYLLWTVGALGVAHGISFSASYQLASKYANKNTIALGLGCVGSGALVLVLELVLRIGAHPSVEDEFALYFSCAGAVVVALVSAVSLLLRHWRSIEAASMGLAATGNAQHDFEDSLRQQLLQEELQKEPSDESLPSPLPSPPLPRTTGEHALGLEDGRDGIDTSLPTTSSIDLVSASSAGAPPSLPTNNVHALLALSPLDFFKSVSDGESTLLLDGHTFQGPALPHGDASLQAAIAAEAGTHRPSLDYSRRSHGRDTSTRGSHTHSRRETPMGEQSTSVSIPHAAPVLQGDNPGSIYSAKFRAPPMTALQASRPGAVVKETAATANAQCYQGGRGIKDVQHEGKCQLALPQPPMSQVGSGMSGEGSSSISTLYSATSGTTPEPQPAVSAARVMRNMWRCQLSLFISGSTTLMVFPLVTYVPTSGTFGSLLPKWLFFVRLFSDLAGRLLPRMQLLAVHHPATVLAQALLLIGLTPLFYLYIIFAPPWFLSDTLACVYISAVFLLNGMVNTNVYVLVPKLVKAEHKALAAGLLAVTYQGAHVVGLLAGAALCFTLLAK